MTEQPTSRAYDTRTNSAVLASTRFAPYRHLPGIVDVPKRELRMLDRFLAYAEGAGIIDPDPEDFLSFAKEVSSKRALLDLRLAFGKFLPNDAAIRETLQDSIRRQTPRSRRCDCRGHEEIVQARHFEPYRDLPGFDGIPIEELRVFDRFLLFAEAEGIEIPTPDDFLRFSEDTKSTRRLRALETALLRILPDNPAVVLTLRDAIRRKAPPKATPKPRSERPSEFSIPRMELPTAWLETLARLERGEDETAPLAESTLKSMEEVLRAYAGTLTAADWPVALSTTGVRLHDEALRDRGARPATLLTATTRLHQFAVRHGEPADLVEALRLHRKALRRATKGVIKLKEARLEALPDLKRTWMLAEDLLLRSRTASTRALRNRFRNEAFVIAFWTLIPMRLADGRLVWGTDIWRDGDHYRIDVTTQKCEVPLRGRLHKRLTPFLDAVLLQGVDPAYLPEMYDLAVEQGRYLLRDVDGRALAAKYPSSVWRAHMGTGAHISRTRIHSELGRLGPEGVEAALALCAQADFATRKDYQSSRVQEALIERGQEMVDGLFEDVADEILSVF